jgi:hypothetical protein
MNLNEQINRAARGAGETDSELAAALETLTAEVRRREELKARAAQGERLPRPVWVSPARKMGGHWS